MRASLPEGFDDRTCRAPADGHRRRRHARGARTNRGAAKPELRVCCGLLLGLCGQEGGQGLRCPRRRRLGRAASPRLQWLHHGIRAAQSQSSGSFPRAAEPPSHPLHWVCDSRSARPLAHTLRALAHRRSQINHESIEARLKTAADLNNDGKINAQDLAIAQAKGLEILQFGVPSVGGFGTGFALGLRHG